MPQEETSRTIFLTLSVRLLVAVGGVNVVRCGVVLVPKLDVVLR